MKFLRDNQSNIVLILISALIILIVNTSTYYYLEKTDGVKQLEATKDLDRLKYSKEIAKKYITILNMSNEQEYQQLREESKGYMSESLRSEFFYNDTYKLGKRTEKAVIKSITTERESDSTYIHKIETVFQNGTIEPYKSTFLVTVIGGKISFVESLGV